MMAMDNISPLLFFSLFLSFHIFLLLSSDKCWKPWRTYSLFLFREYVNGFQIPELKERYAQSPVFYNSIFGALRLAFLLLLFHYLLVSSVSRLCLISANRDERWNRRRMAHSPPQNSKGRRVLLWVVSGLERKRDYFPKDRTRGRTKPGLAFIGFSSPALHLNITSYVRENGPKAPTIWYVEVKAGKKRITVRLR